MSKLSTVTQHKLSDFTLPELQQLTERLTFRKDSLLMDYMRLYITECKLGAHNSVLTKDSTVLLAKVNSYVVGWGVIFHREPFYQCGNALSRRPALMMYVDQQFRGLNIGESILLNAVRITSDSGKNLCVYRHTQRNRSFYEYQNEKHKLKLYWANDAIRVCPSFANAHKFTERDSTVTC